MKKVTAILMVPVMICAIMLLTARVRAAFAGGASIGDAEITDRVERIEIDWAGGSVELKTCDGSAVSFSETASSPLSEDTRLRWELDGTTLRIRHTNGGFRLFTPEKSLTVELPAELTPESVRVDAASAGVRGSVRAREVDIDTASGGVDLTCEAETVKIDTASGDVRLNTGASRIDISTASGDVSLVQEGTAAVVGIGTASGSVTADLDRVQALNIDTASGGVLLRLPEDADFTAGVDTASGDVESRLPMKQSGGSYVCGNGTDRFDIDTASGDVTFDVRVRER